MLSRSRSLLATALLSGLAACTTEVIEKQADPNAPGGNGTTTTADGTQPKNTATSPIADALTIDRVTINQGVEVRLVKDGSEVDERNAPVIANRAGLVRVHAAKDASVRVGKVTAKLHLTVNGEETVLEDGPKAVLSYLADDIETTFNFELEADQVSPDMELSVELVGTTDDDVVSMPSLDVRAQEAAKLRVELIPIKYEADGSNRLPDLSDANVKRYHDALYRMYPVSEVEITQHATLDWEVPIEPTGSGWDQLLGAVMTMREREGIDPDVYYMGVFNPAKTIRDFCRMGGCIMGVAPAQNGFTDIDNQMGLRTALILGYQTERSGGTLAQELAHAMGRRHAPCGNPAAIDDKFPYDDGAIGTTGWDVLGKQLISSEEHVDFMSYCNPVWVSDYTYKAIFDRMSKVSESMAQTQKSVQGPLNGAKGIAPMTYALGKDQIAWNIQP